MPDNLCSILGCPNSASPGATITFVMVDPLDRLPVEATVPVCKDHGVLAYDLQVWTNANA